MNKYSRQRLTLLSFLTIALLLFTAACIEDERDPDAPAGTGGGTPPAGHAGGTPDTDEAEADAEASATVADESEPTAALGDETAAGGLPDPGAEETPVALADRTVTPDAEEVGPQGEGEQGMFPDIRTTGPDLENYSLSIVGEINRSDSGEDEFTNVDLQYQQSAPDTSHMLFDGEGGQAIETWQIGEQMWLSDGEGNVEEVTENLPEEFGLESYLSMLPEIERISDAEETGQEEIEGRTATHYTLSDGDAVQYLQGMQDTEVQDASGSIEIWLDQEEQLVLRMVVDLTWTDAEETENSTQLEYNVTDIGTTEDIEAPGA